MVKIFYAHSSHRESVYQMYEKIALHYGDEMLDVDNSITGSNIFLTQIIDNLHLADIMICDITPDFIPAEHNNKYDIDITPCINSNVMFELGYFSCYKKHHNIILILDESISKSVPSMLRGHYVLRYNSIEDIDIIINKIDALKKILNSAK